MLSAKQFGLKNLSDIFSSLELYYDMALMSVLCLVTISLLSVGIRSSVIKLGSQLSPSSSSHLWPSSSGHFAFGFYRQGNGFAIGIWLVGKPENTLVWTAFRDEPPVSSNATIEFTRDGKLLLRTENGEEKNISALESDAAHSASMLDSGNFVLYNSRFSVIWQSFGHPSDTILGGQNLFQDDQLVSSMSSSDHSSGRFLLAMQGDGNLVAYPFKSACKASDAYWASSSTFELRSYEHLRLNATGFLGLSSGNTTGSFAVADRVLARAAYSAGKNNTIYRATLDSDGIFRLYSHWFASGTSSGMQTEWSALSNQCEVHGICGFNSYCSSKNNNGSCFCYPGFDFIDPDDKSKGCYEKDSGNCSSAYNVKTIENIWFGGDPYSTLEVKRQHCGFSCLEDCNCKAALHINEKCNKYTLPLKYGREGLNQSGTAFFKVSKFSIPPSLATQPPPPAQIIIERKRKLILILSTSFSSIVCLCSIIATFTFFMYKHRISEYRKLSGTMSTAGELTLQWFSYKELEQVTDGFKEELSRGFTGSVYKGLISGCRPVLVKRLENAMDGDREFQAEITVIGRTHHRNLVRLIGFCIEGPTKLLVYEYMKNGSLADLLFKPGNKPIWKERVRIALDVARGLLYLHEECEACIVHCNITSHNILMDDSWTAKISEFGLSKLLHLNRTSLEETIGHTRQLAPDLQNDDIISTKTDIYCFGIVLLEIICCRRNIEVDVSTADEIILSNWVYECFVSGKLDKLVEVEAVDTRTLERMVKVGLWCVQDNPSLRPSIKNVVLMLEGTADIPVPPLPTSSSGIIRYSTSIVTSK